MVLQVQNEVFGAQKELPRTVAEGVFGKFWSCRVYDYIHINISLDPLITLW